MGSGWERPEEADWCWVITSVAAEVLVQAPAARIFRLLDDPRQMRRWLEGLEDFGSADWQAGKLAVGTEFQQRLNEGRHTVDYEGVVTDYQPPGHLGLRLWCPDYVLQVDFRLREEGEATRVRFTADVPYARWGSRWRGWLLGWLYERRVRRRLRNLRQAAEAGRS